MMVPALRSVVSPFFLSWTHLGLASDERCQVGEFRLVREVDAVRPVARLRKPTAAMR